MKDAEYFDGKLFVYTNESTKQLAMKYAKNNQMPLYLVVDKAIRSFLKENGYKIDKTPKLPIMVEDSQ